MDIAPTYTGIVMAVTNTIAIFAGVFTPMVTGYFIDNDPSRDNFRKVFFVAAVVSVIGGTVFSACVRGEELEWKEVGQEEKVPMLEEKDD